MRNWKSLLVGSGLVAASILGIFWASQTSPVQGQPKPAAEKADAALAPSKQAEEFIAAFNKGDAKAVAEMWTPEADYIDQTGRHVHGRAALEKMYEKFFAANKGAKLQIIVVKRKEVTPDVLLENGFSEVTPGDGSPGSVARFAAVLVKKNGHWLLDSVHESVAHPPTHAEHFSDLEWLIGEWAGEEKGESTTATYMWAENQNFIVSTFAMTVNGVPVTGGTQWIAYDPVAKGIRSWSFYSRGGFGEGTWTQDGANKWTIKSSAITADGKKVSVTNILAKTGPDAATWQSTGINVDGKAMPDGPVHKLKRVKSGAQ